MRFALIRTYDQLGLLSPNATFGNDAIRGGPPRLSGTRKIPIVALLRNDRRAILMIQVGPVEEGDLIAASSERKAHERR